MPARLFSDDQIVDRLTTVFRRYGYEGASLSRISDATKLGKASLYHHFPGGKDAMCAAVLESVTAFFEGAIFSALDSELPPRKRLQLMNERLIEWYSAGEDSCLPAMLALGAERDQFAEPLRAYFQRWLDTMTETLADAGLARDVAAVRARGAVARVQGVLIVGRGMSDPTLFRQLLTEMPDQLLAGALRPDFWTPKSQKISRPQGSANG